MIQALANHLWQSMLCAAAAGALTLLMRKNAARTRYLVWLAASLKFLIPFAILVSLGSRVEWRAAPAASPEVFSAVAQVSRPFAEPVSVPAVPPHTDWLPAVLFSIWLCGSAAVLVFWCKRWLRVRGIVRSSRLVDSDALITVRISSALVEPGVFGIFKPVLLLPEAIDQHLSPDQLRAIIAHELAHVRRRDNLASALHMLVEAIFWFHPLVWWIGARLVEERERACDEAVLAEGHDARAYGEGILNVCRFYVESPLACAAGVTGSDLKRRIERIVFERSVVKLGYCKRLLLTAAASAAIAGPIAIGVVHSPPVRAQEDRASLKFEVASVKPSSPDTRGALFDFVAGGGLRVTAMSLKNLIREAYDVRDFQISGGPAWIRTDRFDVNARAESSEVPESPQLSDAQRKFFSAQTRERLRNLLAERFRLVIRREVKEGFVYTLVTGRDGAKLHESNESRSWLRGAPGLLSGTNVSVELVASWISGQLGRPVIDKSGLTGKYDFELKWTPDPGQAVALPGPLPPGVEPPPPPDPNGPSIFTALQEQLGLKLEGGKGPVETLIIEQVEKPTEN